MRKTLSLIALLLAVALGASAETTVKENYVFERLTYNLKIDDSGNHYAVLTKIDKSLYAATIPSIVNYDKNSYTVREIGNGTGPLVWNYQDADYHLGQVVIPGTVERINDRAFNSVVTLGLVQFSGTSKLRYIGNSAFYNCYRLTRFLWPASADVKDIVIDMYAFDACRTLAAFPFPAGLKSIGKYAFNGCSNLESIELKPAIETIGEWAFNGCTKLASVTFQADKDYKLTAIPEYCFNGCTALTTCELPKSVTTICDRAFYECGLTAMHIGSNISSIGYYAFYGCSQLSNLTFDSSSDEISIGTCAFQGCAMTELTLGNRFNDYTLTCYSNIFNNCRSLTKVTLPDGMTTIPTGMFSSCSALTDINTENITTVENEAFQSCTSLKAINLRSCSSVGDKAFNNCSNLETVSGALASSGSSAFRSCRKLAGFETSALTAIGDNCFYGCTALTNVSLNAALTIINSNTFYNCKGISAITIPASITAIGSSAFEGCQNLKIVNNNSTRFTVAKGATTNGHVAYYADAVINRGEPDGYSGGDYDSSTGLVFKAGSNRATVIGLIALTTPSTITLPATVTEIGDGAFQGLTGLTTVKVGGSLKKIGANAFYGCTSLANVSKASSRLTQITGDAEFTALTHVGDNAFYGTALSQLGETANLCYLPAVTSIGANAFRGCKFAEVMIGSATSPTVGSYAFAENTTLVDYTEEQNGAEISVLSEGMFKGCTSLSTFNSTNPLLATTVTRIPDSAFEGCSALPCLLWNDLANVSFIGDNAFKDCTSFWGNRGSESSGSLVLNPMLDHIGTSAFENTFILTIRRCSSQNRKEVELGSNVFARCSRLRSVSFPFAKIGDGMFCGCSSLKYMFYPGFSYVGASAFTSCSDLKQIDLSSAKYIGFGAFTSCNALTSVDLSSAEYIGDNAFESCGALTTATMTAESPLTYLGEYSFHGCKSLTAFTIPASLTEIRPHTFHMWTDWDYATNSNVYAALKTVTVCGSSLKKIGDNAFYDCGNLETINFPESLEEIGFASFYNCRSLQDATMPEAITTIGKSAFNGCAALTTVSLPKNITEVPEGAFSGCTGLTSITLGENIKKVGALAFENCQNVTEIHTGEELEQIGDYSFACRSLQHLYITTRNEVQQVLTIPATPFYGVENATLHVPAGMESYYGNDSRWSGYFSNISGQTLTYNLIDGEPYRRTTVNPNANVTYTRKFSKTSYMPFYVPFYMNYDDWKDYGEVAEIGAVHRMESGADKFTVIEFNTLKEGQRMKANTPYVFKPKTTGTVTFNVENTRLLPADNGYVWCASTRHNYYLIGVYEPTDIYLCYALQNGTFVMIGENKGITNLAPYRFYLTLEAANHGYDDDDDFSSASDSGILSAPARIGIMVDGVIVDDEEATGLSEIFITPTRNDDKVYDLQGRLVEHPSRGIYIKNGKKFVVK